MNQIATIMPAAMSYSDTERLAASIAQSGLFGIKTKDQAIALMMIAQAEGRHPALAARDYDIIQGRPAKKAEAMLRDFFEGGGKVEWHTLTDDTADATFSHQQGGTARIKWDMARAAKAGLTNKDNYKKFPRQMLRSRVVSEGVRTVWPMATSGMYVPDEAADMEPARKEPPHPGPTIEAKADEYVAPSYPFATNKGGRMFATGSEWMEAWRRTADACKATDALDKLRTALDMNQGPIDEVASFDPAAATEIREMIAAALAENPDTITELQAETEMQLPQ